MDHTLGNCVAFDPKENFPLSLSYCHDFANFGQVTQVEFELVNLMDVVTDDNNGR